jgi:phosphoglycolate phosphatase-like HAD superfamily hydrolase
MKIAVDLIMFDLDGTLADTGPDLADAVNYTRAHFELEALPNDLVYTHVGYGVEHLLKHSLPQQQPFQEVMRVFLARYENHLLDKTVLYPGVLAALDYFCDKRRVVAIVRGLGVEDRFDAILGGDSVSDKKPHPALLNEVLRRYPVPVRRALMVGDGDTDVEAGKRAGVVTCGVTYGLGNKKDLAAAQPDFLIEDLTRLSDLFC